MYILTFIHVLFSLTVLKHIDITLREVCYANTFDLRSINAMLNRKLINISVLYLTMTVMFVHVGPCL